MRDGVGYTKTYVRYCHDMDDAYEDMLEYMERHKKPLRAKEYFFLLGSTSYAFGLRKGDVVREGRLAFIEVHSKRKYNRMIKKLEW